MTTDRPTRAIALRRTVAALAIALAPAVLASPPAQAAPGSDATAAHTTSAATTLSTKVADAVPTDCKPDDSTACVAVVVINDAGDRIPDAEVTITGLAASTRPSPRRRTPRSRWPCPRWAGTP